MSGIDPALASALASRIDALLSAVSAPTDAKSAQAADAPAATQWANTPTVPAQDVNQPPPASAQAVLSQTARTLDVIARGADGEQAPPVVGRQALWSAAPGTSATAALGPQALAGLASSLAMALEQALDTSGLFYESHLAQWFAGQRSGALLNQEPQSQLPGAADEGGWPYDADAALRELADAPEPFMGRRTPDDTAQTGSETIDVEVTEVDDGFTGTSPGAAQAGAAQAGANPALPSSAATARAPQLTHAAPSELEALLDAMADDTSAGDPAGTSLVPSGRSGAGADALTDARTSGVPDTAAQHAQASTSYSSTPGSTLFANEGNAAYAAQAAAQVRTGGGTAADRAAENNPTLQASGSPSSLPVHPDALSIVRQQLELLQDAEPRFRWSGEAWPDSRMYWELDWDPNDPRAADQRVWRTRIAIELPTLGLVDAELTLTGHRLGARISADGMTLATLKEGTSDFMRALAGAGLNLEQLAIRNADGNTPGPRAGADDAAPGARAASTSGDRS